MAFDPDEYLNETGASSTATAEFDPDAYLSETEEQEAPFDPDAYLAEVEAPAQPKPPVGTSFIEELAAIPQAIKQSIDQPLEAMGETAQVLGASGIGGALRGAIEGTEDYVPAAQRFMEPQEGEFQVAGFAPQFLPRAIVEQAGQIGGAILTRVGGAAVGGLAGSVLGPKGTVAGAVAGQFIGPALFEMGQIVGPVARERAANQGREEPTTDDLAWAWATAGASGALNAIGAKYIPGGDKLTGSLAKKISTALVGEGSTEGAQSVVQQTGQTFLTEQGFEIKPKEVVGETILGGGAAGTAVVATAPFTKAAAAAETKVVAEQASPIAPETAQAVSEQANQVIQDAQTEETQGGPISVPATVGPLAIREGETQEDYQARIDILATETPDEKVARLEREAQEGVDIDLEEEVPVSGLPPERIKSARWFESASRNRLKELQDKDDAGVEDFTTQERDEFEFLKASPTPEQIAQRYGYGVAPAVEPTAVTTTTQPTTPAMTEPAPVEPEPTLTPPPAAPEPAGVAIADQPSPNLLPRTESTVEARPTERLEGENGRDFAARKEVWDEQYGFMRRGGKTHNDDGTPYQPTIYDETVGKIYQNKDFQNNPDWRGERIGDRNETTFSTSVKDLLNDGWAWDDTQQKMVNPQNPNETPSQGLARLATQRAEGLTPTTPTPTTSTTPTPVTPTPVTPEVTRRADLGIVDRIVKESPVEESNTFGGNAVTIKLTDPETGGYLTVVDRQDGTPVSVIYFEVPKEQRQKGVGMALQARALKEFPNMRGQVSSKSAARSAYTLGRRPINNPNATLDETLALIDEYSSVNMQAPTPEPPALAPLRRVVKAEQTEEDVSGLVGQGLVELYNGQPVITQAGLETLPEAERPRLTPEARKIQIDTRTSEAAAEAISKNLRIGVDQVPADVRMPAGWTLEGDVYIPPVVEAAPVAPTFTKGEMVRVTNRVPTYEGGRVVGGRDELVAGSITRIMPDGKVEVRLQRGGYQTLSLNEVQKIERPAPAQQPEARESRVARDSEVQKAAQDLKAGTIDRDEYQRIVDMRMPIRKFEAVPTPANNEDMLRGLGERKAGDRLKKDLIQNPEAIAEGTVLEARLDIPAYESENVWVVSLHKQRTDLQKGTAAEVVAYTPTSVLRNVTFGVTEKAAAGIAAGKPKSTIATMRGEYVPMTAEQAYELATTNKDQWVEIGMNPVRHSYFYDKDTQTPVESAEEVVQVGGMVLAKNPVFGKREDYLYSLREAQPTVGMTTDAVRARLEALGFGVEGMIRIVEDPQAAFEGRTIIQDGKAVRIELNASALNDNAAIDRVLNHEFAEAANADGALNKLVERLTPKEKKEINDAITRLGYEERVRTTEEAARAIEALAAGWKGRGFFERAVARVEAWGSKLGLKLTRRAAEYIAARNLSDINAGFKTAYNQSINRVEGEEARYSYAGPQAEMPQFMRDSLSVAQAMAAKGEDAETIRSVTGWIVSPYDKKLRWEIPDNDTKIWPTAQREEPSTIETMLSLPEGFEELRAFYGWKQYQQKRESQSAYEIILDWVNETNQKELDAATKETKGLPIAELKKKSAELQRKKQERDQRITDFYGGPTAVENENRKLNRIPLSFILDHPALYEAYPEIAWLPVSFNAQDIDMDSVGSYDNIQNIISLNPTFISRAEELQDARKTVSTILHEIQHWIQNKEGFAVGASPMAFRNAPELYQKWLGRRELMDLSKELGVTPTEAVEQYRGLSEYEDRKKDAELWQQDPDMMTDETINRNLKYFKNRGKTDMFTAYERTAGEIEARDVQARMDMTPKQRKSAAPYSSENISPEDVVIMGGEGGVSLEIRESRREPAPTFTEESPEAKTLSNLKASMEKVDSASETKGGKPETQKVSEIAANWMEQGGDERALQDAIIENTNLSPVNAAKVAKVIAKQYGLQQQIAETGAVIAEIAPEAEGAPRKSSVTKLIEQTTGVRKPVVKLQVSESAALKKQIQLKAREARETRKARKEAAEDLAKSIADYVKANPIRGPINSRQAMSITKRALKLDVNNEAAVDRFEMYVERVIENANYDQDLADARALIKRAKNFAKSKDTQGNVKTTLDAIANISPTLLDNPFEFNLVVQRYLLGLAPVTAKQYAVMPDADVRRYLESLETQISANQDVLNRSKAQRILDKQAAYAEEKGIPLDEAIAILNSEEFLNEKTIEKLEDLTKLLTSMAQESQKDVRAYDETGATPKQKELISFMGKVNLNSLTNEEKKRYIRFSNNFLANGATFGMEQFQSIALGQESAIKALKDKRLSNKLAAWISPIGGDKAIDTARRIALKTQSEADTFKNIFGREAVGVFRKILGLNRLDVAQTDSNRAKEQIANGFGEYFKGLRKKYGNDATGFEAKGYAGIAGYLIQTDGNKTESESIPYRRRLMEQNIVELRKSDRQTDQAEADLKERALAQLTGTTNSEILSQLQALNPASYEQLMWVKDVMLPKWRDFLKEHDENFRNQANNYDNPDHLTITYKFPEGQLLPNEIEDVYQQDMAGMRIKQAANSIKRKDHPNLPVSKAGTVANIDINFGYNQYNALVDQVDKAYVAPAWEQVVAFTKTPEFEQVMGGRANALFVKKLLVDIQTSRTRQSMTDDESQMIAGGVRLARKISTQAVLGGFTQPLRQVPDQLAKLFFTTGRFDLITKNLLKISEAAPLLNKFPIGRRGDAQAGTQYASQFSELARKVEASVTDRKWAQYRELMNRVGEFWMAPLRGSDVWAAKVSWMSYYEAELNKNGIKMESWEREAELVETDDARKEAASYAEFAVDFYGGASDPTKMASLSKQTNNGWKEFAKLLFLPLNSFALQQKNSLISDLRDAYLRTGDRKASIAAISGTLAGMAAFHGMRIYIIGGLLYPAGKALLMGIFGIDMDEPDEEEKQKQLEDNWRKFKASMYGNIVAGGLGEFVEKNTIDAFNRTAYLWDANINPDSLLNDKGEIMSFRQYEKEVSPLYRFRSYGSSEYSFGLADVLAEQATHALAETQQLLTTEEMEMYTGNEQAYAAFATGVEWMYFFRLMDTDVKRIATDLKRQMDKGVEEREKEIKAIRSGR